MNIKKVPHFTVFAILILFFLLWLDSHIQIKREYLFFGVITYFIILAMYMFLPIRFESQQLDSEFSNFLKEKFRGSSVFCERVRQGDFRHGFFLTIDNTTREIGNIAEATVFFFEKKDMRPVVSSLEFRSLNFAEYTVDENGRKFKVRIYPRDSILNGHWTIEFM